MVQLREESRRTLAPDQLGSYIKVSRPSVWMLMAVIVALLVAGAAWFFAGTVNESVSGPCIATEQSCVAYAPLTRASEIQPGNDVVLSNGDAEYQGTVASTGGTPVAKADIRQLCGAADLPAFSQDSWGVAVAINADVAPGTYTARVITASHRPIMLLLGLD